MRPTLSAASAPLLAAMLLAGCTSPALPPASQYRVAQPLPPMVLVFAPDADAPTPYDQARLREAAAALPPATLPELHILGPRTLPRALAVRRLLQRPVAVLPSPLPGAPDTPDVAVLAFPGQPAVVADACLGPGAPPVEGFWPGSGLDAPRLRPEGCAVAGSIQAQVNANAGTADLLRGRRLEPGAALPFTDAIERYYRRNDSGQHGGSQSAPASGGSTTPSSGAVAASAVNPLLGPLPDAPGQPQQAQTQGAGQPPARQ